MLMKRNGTHVQTLSHMSEALDRQGLRNSENSTIMSSREVNHVIFLSRRAKSGARKGRRRKLVGDTRTRFGQSELSNRSLSLPNPMTDGNNKKLQITGELISTSFGEDGC